MDIVRRIINLKIYYPPLLHVKNYCAIFGETNRFISYVIIGLV